MHKAGSSSDFEAGAEANFVSPRADIEPVIPAQRGVRDAARGEVLLRYARLQSSGRPVFCTGRRPRPTAPRCCGLTP